MWRQRPFEGRGKKRGEGEGKMEGETYRENTAINLLIGKKKGTGIFPQRRLLADSIAEPPGKHRAWHGFQECQGFNW